MAEVGYWDLCNTWKECKNNGAYLNKNKIFGQSICRVGSRKRNKAMSNVVKEMSSVIKIYKANRENFIDEVNQALDQHKEGYLLLLSPEDRFEEGFEVKMTKALDQQPEAVLISAKKLFQFPDRIAGTMINLKYVGKLRMKKELKYDAEADFLLRLVMGRSFLLLQDTKYVQTEPGDGNFQEFEGLFEKDWYTKDFDDFLLPLLKESAALHGNMAPDFLQYFAMYFIRCRLDANMNNRNRHVLVGEEIDEFKEKLHETLQWIRDSIIMNNYGYPIYSKNFLRDRMLLRIKHGKEKLPHILSEVKPNPDKWLAQRQKLQRLENAPLRLVDTENLFMEQPMKSGLVMNFRGHETYGTSDLKCNIQAMDVRGTILEIDGSLPDIFPKEEVKYYFRFNGERTPVNFNEAYSLTKYFGQSAWKRFTFHAEVDLGELKGRQKERLIFCLSYDGKEYEIPFEYDSHFSRLSAYPKNSYWHADKYIFTNEYVATGYVNAKKEKESRVTAIIIQPYNWFRMAARELGTQGELLFSFQKHRLNFFLLRAAWVVTHPFFRKKIWMFYDKIYKGGDSSEYLYRYCEEQKDGIKKYYLLDEKTSDYKRLQKDGYKPLKRGSFLHRLVFLNADMMIVSNSTVFAFNDYYMENSRYIRGIPDFHVVCVQHGLSVQKIGLAQTRLRDNTRLYFCASKYEIENLQHPVYNYAGTEALQLTGVPRYDGLVDEEKKQIMISPTWRMQAAKLVTRNEGVERDYNPEFKETPYFQVYNGLINDKRLIDAAEKYGYRIKYVLHPIVSPQEKDFTKNKFVDIIPAVGDMSYEQMFRDSSLMVTDYSGIQFDFAYMRKPLVYYHPEELEAHYEEGTFKYDTMAFGEIVHKRDELVDLLVSYMENGCKMKEEYVKRADDFYEFSDHKNCERIYNVMLPYAKKYGKA